jgi:hypothetical protein
MMLTLQLTHQPINLAAPYCSEPLARRAQVEHDGGGAS